MDVERARFNMVEQQIRPWEVLDQTVLDLLSTVRREEFVPADCRAIAFADLELPIGHGEAMWTPKMEARVVQELSIRPSDQILEVGTGSGYLAALLGALGAHVHSVEIVPELAQIGRSNLARAGVGNVTVEVGDAAREWPNHAPYDAIVMTGSTPILPDQMLKSLKPGGRLFAVVGDFPIMRACLYRVLESGAQQRVELFDTVLRPLRNAVQPERFVF